MLFPPKSGRKVVRLHTADSIDGLGHTYTTLMSAWITESEAAKDTPYTASSTWVKAFRRRLIAVTAQIQANKQQMMLATWEGSIRGRWPREEYAKLMEVQEEIVAVLSQVCNIEEMWDDPLIVYIFLQLGGALWKLDTQWRLSIIHNTKVVDPNFVRDSLSVISKALILL